MTENELSKIIVEAAYQVHVALGPGLLEGTYEACLIHELNERGLLVESQIVLPVKYKGTEIELGYRLDLFIEKKVIVEIKAVNKLLSVHEAQLLSYLKLSHIKLGLLINFNVEKIKDGIKRRVNGL